MRLTNWRSLKPASFCLLLLSSGCIGFSTHEIHRVCIDWNSYQQCAFHKTTKHHLSPTEFETRQLMWPYNTGFVTHTQQPLPSPRSAVTPPAAGPGNSALPLSPRPEPYPHSSLISPLPPIHPADPAMPPNPAPPYPLQEPESGREPLSDELPVPPAAGSPSVKRGFRDLLEFAKPPEFGPRPGSPGKPSPSAATPDADRPAENLSPPDGDNSPTASHNRNGKSLAERFRSVTWTSFRQKPAMPAADEKNR